MVSYRDVQHLRKKTVKRTKKRTGAGTRRYRKGSPSKTRPGRKDFVTHKGSKFYDRAGHRYTYALGNTISSLPYTIFGIKSSKKTRKSRKVKKGGGSYAPTTTNWTNQNQPLSPITYSSAYETY